MSDQEMAEVMVEEKSLVTVEDAQVFTVDLAEVRSKIEDALTIQLIPDDKDSYAACKKARMYFVHKRNDIDRRLKELNEEDRERIKKRGVTAKELKSILEPGERHFTDMIEAEDARLEAIEEEKKRQLQQKITDRMTAFSQYGAVVSYNEVAAMTDEEFDTALFDAAEEHKEQERIRQEEEAARRAEEERLAEERAALEAELAREREAREEAQRKLDAEKAAMEAEKKKMAEEAAALQAEKDRLEREALEKQEAEARRIAEEKAAEEAKEREAQEAKERAEREAAEAARQEALKPDKDKLSEIVESIRAAIDDEFAKLAVSEQLVYVAELLQAMLVEACDEANLMINRV